MKISNRKKNKKKSRIPEFSNYGKEARWWENHNLADYQDEFKSVKVRFAKNLSEGLHIRLDKETLLRLRYEAKEKGIGPTTLVRMLVKEHFR
jgi:hypothetical protein